MDECLSAWRMVIGMFYNGTHGVESSSTIISYPFHTFLFILGLLHRIMTSVGSKCVCSVNWLKSSLLTFDLWVTLSLLTCDLYYLNYKTDRFYNFYHPCYIEQSTFDKYNLIVTVMKLILSNDIELNPGPNNNEAHCLSIFHQNMRSMRNKLDYIKDSFLDFDILCFTETHLTNVILNDSLIFDGFNSIHRKDSTSHSGGLLVYISNCLVSKRLLNLETILPESIWIEIRDQERSYLICTIYRPPNAHVEIWNRIDMCLEKAFELSNNIILLGDINEDQLNMSTNKFRDILTLYNMSNVIHYSCYYSYSCCR